MDHISTIFKLLFMMLILLDEVTPNDQCWNSETKCTIAGEFIRTTSSVPFSVNIQCEPNSMAPKDRYDTPYWTRFHDIEIVALNGCEANEKVFATEYIPDPASVKKLRIEMFRVYAIPEWSFKALAKLKRLQLQYNAIGEIFGKSFVGLDYLEELVIDHNSIERINQSAFLEAPQIKRLQLWEKHLDLNFTSIGQLKNLSRVDLELRHIVFPLRANHCNIENLRIFGSTLENWESMPEKYFHVIKDLSLNFANLTRFRTIDNRFATLLKLNLSHNFIDEIELANMSFLTELDLSHNRLQALDKNSFSHLPSLVILLLQKNILTNLDGNFLTQPINLQHVNLAHNLLQQIDLPKISTPFNASLNLTDNPWECQWLLNISSTNQFQHFIYPKSLDGISVHGLQCAFHEPDSVQEVEVTSTPRRSAKSAAKTTLFIIGLGFCSLILLLVLHLKCRSKSPPPPFYREIEQRVPAGRRVENHCDVVRRQLPSTDYEAPIISRRTSMCNLEIYEEIPEKKADIYLDQVTQLVQRENNIENV